MEASGEVEYTNLVTRRATVITHFYSGFVISETS